MRFVPNPLLPEVFTIQPKIYKDERGHFLETFKAKKYVENGIFDNFVQDNLSYSTKKVLRGLHYQLGNPQGKLVWVVDGKIFDVAVDIRKGSPTFGKCTSMMLSSKEYSQAFIPQGFAHGFCVISETATVLYKCSDYYAPQEERGIRWDDPALAIDWPITDPVLSEKDSNYLSLEKTPEKELPVFIERPSGS